MAFENLQHGYPLFENPLRSSLFTDQDYSSIETGIYLLLNNEASK